MGTKLVGVYLLASMHTPYNFFLHWKGASVLLNFYFSEIKVTRFNLQLKMVVPMYEFRSVKWGSIGVW